MFGKKEDSEWRDGVYLTTVEDTLQADILESKLLAEGIPVERKYEGSANYMEIVFGRNFAFPIKLYVPEECLEDAKNAIEPVEVSDEELERQALEGDAEEE